MLNRFPRPADAWLFAGAAALAAVLGGTAVVASLGTIGRTFPGFVVWNNLVVAALGRSSWTGLAADVPFRNRVLRVDDVTVRTRADLDAVVGAGGPGTVHRYEFDGVRGAAERLVPAMRFKLQDWAATMGIYVFNGIAFLGSGLAAFYLKPESPQSRALLSFGTIWGLVLLLAVDAFTAGRFGPLGLLLESLAPAATVHLALVFPEPRRHPRWAPAFLYGIGLGVGTAQIATYWDAYDTLIAINDATYLSLAASGVVAFAAIAAAAARAPTPVGRRRARVVLAGTVLAFGLPLPPMLAFFLVGLPVSFSLLTATGFLFPLAIGYAVVRHDLFEADRFVKQSVVWATLTVLVALAYAGSVLAADRLAAELDLRHSPLFPIAFVLIVLATITPLRDRVQQAVDRVFGRARIDYRRVIAHTSERLATLLDREAIVGHVLSTMQRDLLLDGAGLWERDAAGLVRRGTAPVRIPEATPGLATLLDASRPLSRDETEQSIPLRPERHALRALFDRLEAALVVPMLREGRCTGLLTVRGRASGAPLAADDIETLRTLANEAALALANAAAVEALAEARSELVRSERLAAVGELSAAVAHGIRNPLAGIRLAAQLGLEATDDENPLRENLADILEAVAKLETQVRGVLDFARPLEPRLEDVDARALIARVLEAAAGRLRAAGIHVAVDVPPALPPLRADPVHLGQALQELIANAIDAMPGGGTITIDVRVIDPDRRTVAIGIADEGPGVPPELEARIFQLFATTKADGTGVGLAVAKKIVERHGGHLRLDRPGRQGARFVLELPAA